MKITNCSSYSDEEVFALSQKVVPYFKYQKRATVEIRNEAEWGGCGHGIYYPEGDQIIIWLPRGVMYPFRDLYRKRAGDRLIHCWQDLFVAILAHELRHCDQRWMKVLEGVKTYHYEVDAEKYAGKVLARYRQELDEGALG